MSYEVTATRRRPQRFEDLAGQEFVAETLRNSIQSQKIAHAYLFSGPRGCGKTSTARILAKALNCANGPTATPCGECQQCKEITKGACTDVIEIDGASNTSVNDVRQIKDEVLFPPQSCRYKIYIIDEVHMLSTSAFNALLKTIEEPPPYVIFIFATTELQKVPATIKSRCQQFNFRLVPIERVKQLLEEACKDINIQAEDEALYWVARESTGSVRDAYTLFDQVAAFSGDIITYDKIRDKLGLVGVDRLNAIFEDCALGRTQDALTKLDGFLQSGISIEQLISNATDYLRSLLLIKNGITKEALLGQAAERYAPVVLEKWNSVQIERALSLLLQLYRDIRYSLNPRYELELAFSRLSWLSQYVSPAEVKAAIDNARALLQGAAPAGEPQARAGQPGPFVQQGTHMQPAGQSGQFGQFGTAGSAGRTGNAGQPAEAQPAHSMHGMEGHAAAPQQAQPVPQEKAPQSRPAFGFSALSGSSGNAAPSKPAPAANRMPMFSALSGSAPTEPVAQAPATAPNPAGQAAPGSAAAPAANAGGFQSSPVTAQPGTALAQDVSDSGQPLPPLEMESYDDGTESDMGQGSAPAFSNGGAVPPEQAGTNPQAGLKEQLITRLTVKDTILAALLMRTGRWIQTGSQVSCEVDSSFLKSQLEGQAVKIAAELSALLGQNAVFSVRVQVQQKQELAVDAPREVQLICSMFKGTVVGKGPKAAGQIKRQPVQNTAVEFDDDDMTGFTGEENDESF
ncbi:MAG: DNA polymerase III subunit gamma/tau [Treponema sp.]|nr:DNA polymerase III subunit gamma/tau [Treponema sp.]